MRRRAPSLLLLVSLLVGLALPSIAAAADPPLPGSMAAVGDSISQAASTGGSLGADAPQNSWSTGTSSTVNSHYLRLLAAGAPIGGQNHNRSVSGAKMADLDGQMASVVGLQPDYVTVLIGGNDLCTDSVTQMTSVATFRAQFETALSRVMAGTSANVYVVSIPNVYQLWNLFKGNFWARFIWSTAGICQSLLANPTSTQTADVQRRDTVRQRNIDYNAQLAQVCALYAARCRTDGNAAFNTVFTTADVSGDYFHPSVSGQAKLAAVSWAAGYSWATTPPPNVAPAASFTHGCVDLTCAFTDTSTDDDGAIVARQWSFGDGTSSTAVNPTRTYTAGGTYTVNLTVTDDDGATSSVAAQVTVASPPAATPMWVGGLSSTTSSARNGWTASVTITVHDSGGTVSGVAVSGTWSAGSGSGGCTTGASGTCQVSVSLNKKAAATVYSVTGLARTGWVYQPESNLATSVSITKP
jgi:PKD repeat protein